VAAELGLPVRLVRPLPGSDLSPGSQAAQVFSSPGIILFSVRLLMVTAINGVTIYYIRIPEGIRCEE
jgi:hypothetical protein